MEAVQEGIDTLASLEERINRAVQVISSLRSENQQLQQRLKASQEQLTASTAQREAAEAGTAAFQKEKGELEQKVQRLSTELETLRGERKQVKVRIEKLLSQLDLLSAS
jgi:chromosome segregation ATPase